MIATLLASYMKKYAILQPKKQTKKNTPIFAQIGCGGGGGKFSKQDPILLI